MASYLPDTLKDWSGVIFGLTGFVIALITLFRAIASAKRDRTRDLITKRQAVFGMLVASETAILSSCRQYRQVGRDIMDPDLTVKPNSLDPKLVRDLGSSFFDLSEISTDIDKCITSLKAELDLVGSIKIEIQKDIPTSRLRMAETSNALDGYLLSAVEWSNKALSEERDGEVLDEYKEKIRLIKFVLNRAETPVK